MTNNLVIRRDNLPGSEKARRAAQYVRMSTDEQDYSTLNQEDAIAAYAAAHGIQIVRKYSDEARSGLDLNRRPALKSLLKDVQTKQADFEVILVYDVSRWGRFQDADESAHYEYLCKEKGIPVIYCAEDFENDGSLASTLLKTLQRVDAAGYSRRLSSKVFAGHCTLGSRGFWQGAPPGYGLRRSLIDARGSPRVTLAHGERKFIQSDRVILVPGPADEVALVRRMFISFAFDGKNEIQIAKELNEEGHVNEFGRPWNRTTISNMLSDEKYVGNNIYNRTSFKLKIKAVKNPPEMWIRSVNAFGAVVDEHLFQAVQRRFAELTRRKSDQHMLENLSHLLKLKGRLNSTLINNAESMPTTQSYKKRFGSLANAYELIGYRPSKFSNGSAKRETSLKRQRILQVLFAEMRRLDLTARFDFNARAYVVNDKFRVQIYMLRCLKTEPGHLQWILRQRRQTSIDLAVSIRMDAAEGIHDFVLSRSVDLPGRQAGTPVDVSLLGGACFKTVEDLANALADAIGRTTE
ncbi:recombinase family protein [Bradyrhizobium sp. 27S5]|uniref:recombinase family protein n=1 Tax=Bradyrhizobium sp. 27S5 TaxID=3139728 RepID=UPI0030D2A523